MENFIVSARKYRPSTFDMVIGQDPITSTLKNAIKNRQIAHAYLFCGPRGVGKTTCARIFAKTINCFNIQENGEACDKCESCVSFNTLRSFNIHELDAASNNKVEDIRTLIEQVRIPPQIGKFSVYIIDEVHMLSSSAFNAFLKTLEEPPSHAIFILATTEKHKIIPTILSRCQIFDFQRIRVEDIVERLKYVAKNESVSADENALHVIAMKADGSMRDALSIFDQLVSYSGNSITYETVLEHLNVLDYEYYFRTVDAALAGDVAKILLTFNEVLTRGFDGHNFIAGLNSHFRNLLVCKDEVTLKLLDTAPAIREKYLSQSRKCSREFIYRALEIGSNCDLGYKSSKNQRLHVELALIKLCNISETEPGETEKKKSQLKPEKKDIHTLQPQEPKQSQKQEVKSDILIARESKPPENKIVSNERSLSIKELINGFHDTQTEEKVPTEIKTDELPVVASSKEKFDPDEFLKLWKKFTETVKNEGPRVSGMFKSLKVEVHKDKLVTIHLNNIAQKELFNRNYKQRLLAFMEEYYGKDFFEIETVVDPVESEDIIYSDEQKYQFLTSKYPAIKDIRKKFNLDFE
ncbi:MAG TPA: DNA polymerase III subunit gamma/tau [Bacteroidales bacterium]|nr:DNA polymerase III subunit gamma/tau [Bacteroidales bacterium]HOM39708.1 DNA polymerase III subunit gamma/tau [Bacteroidales bacterium]HOU30075.1 DNA polymerase III subunit gamma/tau [Bacteroidales bacterium]HPP92010.1 DNA polymerase III subunit gamma/tau [Bacteroidales bacterium]HQG56239.1 DNA polymerase III subunit gamma/tau [Bacteroidales bacterium]